MRRFQILIAGILGCAVTEAHAWWWVLRGATFNRVQLGQTDPIVPDMFPFTALSALGFTQADQLIFMLCPLVAVLGSMVRLSIRALGWSEKRDRGSTATQLAGRFRRQLSRTIVLTLASIFIAFTAGLIVALYFAGSIVPTREGVGKLLAFSVLVGFMAPSFFTAQEEKLTRLFNDTPA